MQPAKPLSATARDNILEVFAVLSARTRVSRTRLSELIADDRAFINSLPSRNLNTGTYDKVMARISRVWPEEFAWPTAVPRPEPGEALAETINEIAAAVIQDLTADIPKPTSQEG